jgi:Tfp pilus assembly protein PilF
MSLPIGTILGQRYEIRAFIGSDGMLDVYKGLDLRLGRDVAMTVLEILSIHTPEELIGFEKEAQIRAGLHHPRIMTIHDFGHGAGCAYQVAEWLDGQSLRKRSKQGPLDWKEIRSIAEAVIEGLEAIHHKGYTLRILDTSSVFLQQDGQVKLFAYQLKRVNPPELLKAEKEGLQALARTLLQVLGDNPAQAVHEPILSTLRECVRNADLDAIALRKLFENLVRGKSINPVRPLKRRWLAPIALGAVGPILLVFYLQQHRDIQPPVLAAPLDAQPLRDPEANRLYLQGMALLETLEPGHLRRAQAYLQSAITRDPTHGLSYSALGKCYSLMGMQHVLPREEALRLSQATIQRALSLDPRLGQAHAALAFQNLWYTLDWPGTEREYRQALALAPEAVDVLRDFGSYLAIRGQWGESERYLKAALERDPLSRSSRTSYGVSLHWSGRSEEALEEFVKAIDQDPTSWDTLFDYQEVLEQLGRFGDALQVSDRLAARGAISDQDAFALRTAFETRTPMGYWTVRVRQAEKRSDMDPTRLAELVCLQGDKPRALRLLGKALQEKSLHAARIPNSPAFASLRTDPRFRQILQKMGYPDS